MTNPNAFRLMCKALALAAGVALAELIYSLYLIGVTTTGFLMGLSTAFLFFAVIVFGAVVMYLD
jgi:hypothetical protein